jgi:drug/metabolite transporter, DME family
VPEARSDRPAVLAVAGAAVLWSSGGLFIKVAPYGPLGVACGRAVVTTIFYLVFFRPDLRKARLSTGLAYAAMIVTFVSATKLTTAANAIFLQYTGPAYVLALSPWMLGEPFDRVDAACVALSLAGMSLFFVGRVEPGQLAGNLLGVLSGLSYALTVLLLRRDAKQGARDALPSTALGNLLAAVFTLPFAANALAGTTVQGALVLLYLGVVQMGIAYWLFARGLRTVPASEASLLSMLEPILNPVWVFLGAGERPGPWTLAGGAVVIAAVAFRALRRPEPDAAVSKSA